MLGLKIFAVLNILFTFRIFRIYFYHSGFFTTGFFHLKGRKYVAVRKYHITHAGFISLLNLLLFVEHFTKLAYNLINVTGC